MQVDKDPFSMNVLECNNPAVLVWVGQAKSTAGKNVVIGEPRRDEKKYHHYQVPLEKDEMGKNKLTITIGPSSQKKSTRNNHQEQAKGGGAVLEAPQTGLASLETGQAGSTGSGGSGGRLRTYKPQYLEIGTWKSNVPKNAGAEISLYF